MEKKVIFGLLILWGFMSQGFCTSSEENEKSSDIHIRKKRVVGYEVAMMEAPFLVSLITNGNIHCPATLLTDRVVITSAECFKERSRSGWQIQAGLTLHRVINVIPYGKYNSLHPSVNNLALAFFHPPINYLFSHNRPIIIYCGNLATVHEYPTAFNWRFEKIGETRRQSATEIRKVILQLISYQYCHFYYPDKVGPGNICTQSSIQRHYCQQYDTGAPLVIEKQLLGIFAFRGNSCLIDPDVFMNMKDDHIRHWIYQHVPVLHLC